MKYIDNWQVDASLVFTIQIIHTHVLLVLDFTYARLQFDPIDVQDLHTLTLRFVVLIL